MTNASPEVSRAVTPRSSVYGAINHAIEGAQMGTSFSITGAHHPWSVMLPKPPSVNHCYGQAPGHRRYKTADYKAWETTALAMLRQIETPIYFGEVFVTLTFQKARNRRADSHNYIKPVMDLLVGAGIITDDSDEVVLELVCRPCLTGHTNGVRIEISPFHISRTISKAA